METYDWAWVETQVSQTMEVWHRSAVTLEPGRRYSPHEQRVNEDAYDQALLEVESALRPLPSREKIAASFARFSAKALSLDKEATE